MGLFDGFSGQLGGMFQDPNQAGLLGLSQGLLASAGASRLPVTMGAALANGLAGAQQSYAGAQEAQARAIANQTARFGLQRQQMMMGILGGLLAGQGNTPQGRLAAGAQAQPNVDVPAGTQMPAPPGMDFGPVSQGGEYGMGGVGPTTANVNRPVPPGIPGSYFDPSRMYQEGHVLSMLGFPGGKDEMELAIGHDPAIAAQMPTDFAKTLIGAGINPGTPAYQAAMAAQANKLSELTGYRAGSFLPDGRGGFLSLPSAPPAGAQLTLGPKGWQMGSIDGALPLIESQSAATTAGKVRETPLQGVDGNGNPTWYYPTPPSPGGTGAAQRAPAPAGAPGTGPAPIRAAAAATSATWQPKYGGGGVRPGQSAQEIGDVKQGQTYLDAARGDSQNVGVYRSLLDEAGRLASDPNVHFGPGSPEIARLKALAGNLGVDWSGAQTAQDIMTKISNQIATTQLGTAGTGSDKQLDALIHSGPNGEMTNDAIKQVIPILQGQLAVKENRAMVMQKIADSTGHSGNVPSALTYYNRYASPEVVQLGQQIRAAKNSGQLDQFMAKLPDAQRGLLGKVGKLGAIGAFDE